MQVTIVGTGKVAKQLGKALIANQIHVAGVYGRNTEKSQTLANELGCVSFSDYENIPPHSLALICVSDGAIKDVLLEIPNTIKVAYTSGSIRLENLPQRESLGVFYPLQTFSENKEVAISSVPFLIESKNKDFETELSDLAKKLSENVLLADSALRYHIHIAAVILNNFSNFLFYLAEKHLKQKELNLDILKPLLKETIEKLDLLSPKEAQTGPAVRGDNMVIQNHISSIKDVQTKELYALFSEFIQQEFKKDEL